MHPRFLPWQYCRPALWRSRRPRQIQPLARIHCRRLPKSRLNRRYTLTNNGASWTLDNGIVKITVPKSDGNLSEVIYHGIRILGHGKYWEQTPAGTITARVTIDPATNGGERGEAPSKGVNPRSMDIETRYTLERGSSGFYTYAEYTHPASYPFVHPRRHRIPAQNRRHQSGAKLLLVTAAVNHTAHFQAHRCNAPTSIRNPTGDHRPVDGPFQPDDDPWLCRSRSGAQTGLHAPLGKTFYPFTPTARARILHLLAFLETR